MAQFLPKFEYNNVIKTAVMLGGFKVSTGQWVKDKRGATGRMVISRKFKSLPLPLKVAVVRWDNKESFEENNSRFSRAVKYTK